MLISGAVCGIPAGDDDRRFAPSYSGGARNSVYMGINGGRECTRVPLFQGTGNLFHRRTCYIISKSFSSVLTSRYSCRLLDVLIYLALFYHSVRTISSRIEIIEFLDCRNFYLGSPSAPHSYRQTQPQNNSYVFHGLCINQSIKTILLQTPIVYTEDILTRKQLEFVKGKPKGTNPAIMCNPINVYAAGLVKT